MSNKLQQEAKILSRFIFKTENPTFNIFFLAVPLSEALEIDHVIETKTNTYSSMAVTVVPRRCLLIPSFQENTNLTQQSVFALSRHTSGPSREGWGVGKKKKRRHNVDSIVSVLTRKLHISVWAIGWLWTEMWVRSSKLVWKHKTQLKQSSNKGSKISLLRKKVNS